MRLKVNVATLFAVCWVVAEGACEGRRVSSFGYAPGDSTVFVQKALDSGATKLIFGKECGPWVVRPLFLRSNTELVFEEGVELVAKKGEFKGTGDSLISGFEVTNVVLRGLGKGAVLRMNFKDYFGPGYRRAEWRHALNLRSVVNVTVENLTLRDSGGDGIYLGVVRPDAPCQDVIIRDCVCDHNNRQGISVISANRLLIERTKMINTCGMAPKAGIDFEPNDPENELTDIVMRDCLTERNDGAGYELAALQLTAASKPVSISLERCRGIGDGRSELLVTFDPDRRGKGIMKGGRLRAVGCTFSECRASTVSITDKPLGTMDVLLEDCRIENGSTRDPSAPDVLLVHRDFGNPKTDGVTFRNVTVRQGCKRDWCAMRGYAGDRRPCAVGGEVTVESEGRKERIRLDEGWRKRIFPDSGQR